MRAAPQIGRAGCTSAGTRRLLAAAAGPARRGRPPAAAAAPRRAPLRVAALLDYVATASDDGPLRLPARTELDASEITSVFGWPRDMSEKYKVGKVIGAGSFGTVREAKEKATGLRYAVKTVSKVPKRGPPTPRYLLKLRAECEVMQQLGVSLNAVALHDVFEDDRDIHMIMELCEGWVAWGALHGVHCMGCMGCMWRVHGVHGGWAVAGMRRHMQAQRAVAMLDRQTQTLPPPHSHPQRRAPGARRVARLQRALHRDAGAVDPALHRAVPRQGHRLPGRQAGCGARRRVAGGGAPRPGSVCVWGPDEDQQQQSSSRGPLHLSDSTTNQPTDPPKQPQTTSCSSPRPRTRP
jgi:hypothetical protein